MMVQQEYKYLGKLNSNFLAAIRMRGRIHMYSTKLGNIIEQDDFNTWQWFVANVIVNYIKGGVPYGGGYYITSVGG